MTTQNLEVILVLSGTILIVFIKLSSTIFMSTTNNIVKRSRGRPKNEARREEIIATASRLFGELGLKATTMEHIAKELGVSKLTLYSRFSDKDELFSAVIKNKCQQHIPENFFADFEHLAVEESLFRVALALLQLLTSEGELKMERMLIGADSKEQSQLTRLFYEAGPTQVKKMISNHLIMLDGRKQLCVPDPELSANIFAAMIKGSDIVLRAFMEVTPSATQEQIETYCTAVVKSFIASHLSNDG